MRHKHPKPREAHHIYNGRFLERYKSERSAFEIFLELVAIATIIIVLLIPLVSLFR
jgi:hypothetical protein